MCMAMCGNMCVHMRSRMDIDMCIDVHVVRSALCRLDLLQAAVHVHMQDTQVEQERLRH